MYLRIHKVGVRWMTAKAVTWEGRLKRVGGLEEEMVEAGEGVNRPGRQSLGCR